MCLTEKQYKEQNKTNTMNQLGQHFLKDKDIIDLSIESANIKSEDVILEIGSGNGVLTKEIAKENPAKIYGAEIDPELFKRLSTKKIKNLELYNINGLYAAKTLKYNKIISNIPYHISEPLFHIIIKKNPELCVLLIGTNFFDVLESETKIGISTRAAYIIKKIIDVPSTCFEPEPRTGSVLIKLVRKKEVKKEDKIKIELIKQEDKYLKNALENACYKLFGMTKKEAKQKINNFPEELLKKRVMHLSNLQFTEVVKIIQKK